MSAEQQQKKSQMNVANNQERQREWLQEQYYATV